MDKTGLRDALPQPKLSDTRTEQFWNDFDSNLSAAMAAQQQPVTSPATKRDLDVGLGDVARGVGAGALDLVGGIGELARQASQFGKENAGKQGGDYLEQARANMASKLSPVLDKVAGVGDLAKSGAESLTEGMSGDAKEAIGRSLIDETPEGRLTVGDGAGDIDVWAMKFAQGIGSMVPTLGAGAATAIGRAVTVSMIKRGVSQKLAEQVAAKTVHLSTGAAMATGVTGSVGSAGVNTRESVLGMSFDELSQSDTFRQAFTRIDQDQQTQHLSDEEKLSLAREETANVASRATMSDAKVWGAAAMGSVMGDAMLFKMLAGKAATGGVLKGAAKGAVGEGIGETLEEGVQQYTINESLNEVAAADIDPMKGVVSSALEGGLIGMGTGGALGGAGGLRGSKSQPESEGGAQVDPATVEGVAPVEPGDPVQANPAAAQADPDLAPAADTIADPVVAPSGEQSPLGPSASQFPGVFERDQRGILRVKGDVDALAAWAEQANMPYITDGDGIAIPAKYAKQAEKAIKGYQPVPDAPAVEPVPQADLPPFSEVDPIEETPAFLRQSIARAGSETDSVFGPLQTMRITKRGKPFSSEKEAEYASRKGKEMPVPLNGGGFGVAEIAEVEQVQASNNSNAINGPQGNNQPQAEVSNEPVTPVPAISSEGQGDQPGAGEPAAAGAGPAVAGLADRAGSGNPADNTPAPPVPDGQQQNDPTLTAPAPDAGAAVSEVAQPDPVVPAPVAAPAASEPAQQIETDAAPVSNVRMSQQQEGLSVDEASKVVDDFLKDYNGNIPVEPFIREKANEIYGPAIDEQGLGDKTKGAYHPGKSIVTVVSRNARDGVSSDRGSNRERSFSEDQGRVGSREVGRSGAKADLITTLRHELLGHYGTDTFTPENKQRLLQKLIEAKNEKWIAPVWKQIVGDSVYGKKSDLHQAEEVFAHIAEKELPPRTIQAWNDIKTEFARLLRKAGLVKGPIKEHELDSLIKAVGKGIRNGERTKQNIRGDQEVIGKQADEPAKDDKPERIISFSKQAMAQGEKPAKHLTRKEAELVTKEWFKQYRGASGIDVQIHATQAELEQALGLAAKDGLIRRAAFDDDNGTLHVAADTIAHPKRMREILRHEVLAHYGLANVLGDGEYTKLISRIIKSKSAPSMKAVWDWVDTHYAGEDVGVQAEEVIAHLAELEQSAWRRGWDQVVAWVTKALRTVGFVPGGITAAETRVLIEGLGKKMKRGGPDNGGPDGGHKFSQESEQPAKKGGLKMSQSVADNSPSLEQSITQKAVYQAGAALGSVKNWMKQGRPVMLGTLTDLQIDQVYRDITGGAVSEYQRLRTQMEADRNDILLDAETRIDPLWDALDKQVKADLSNLMHDATMARLHPDKSLDENSYYQEAKQKVERAKKPETRAAYEAELHIIERNHTELAKQYNSLPANAKALYGTMQDTYTKQWESLRGAIEQRLEDLLGVSEGRAMAAEMRHKMEHALQHGPYFPLTRYGDYVVKARKGDEYVREHFERRADAEQAVKQYQRDGYNAVMTVKEEGGGDSANANQLGMEMLSFLDSADGVSKTALKDEIWQAMLRMMPDASYAKHAIHRRRVKGASRDAHRAYLNSVYHYARHVSKIRYGHKMQGELDKLSEQIRAGVAGEPSSLKPEDLEIAQQVLNEMNKRHDLNMNPTGKAWAGSAGNIGFLYYIGPSVASAVVNMTQNFTVMLPQLGAKYGFAKSAAAMTQALRDYVKHGKFKAGTTEAWHSLTRSTTLPADERAILDRLYRAGALDLTQAHSIAAKADTDQQEAKPMGKHWRRAMRWAGATFHNAEVLNREVAALAAYRLLKQAEPTLDGQQYADRVAEMVYDGHGNYAASNRPRYMRNDITKVLTQFKIYSQMMTYVIYFNAIKAAKAGSLKAWKKGVLGKELTQDDLRAIADGKLAAKTLGGVLATHWVMAGVMGLPTPLTFAAYAIAAGLDDDDDRSGEASFRLALTEALGPRAGELLAKGPMDALTNLSIAGRTGLGDLWWRSPKEGTEGDDLAWHAVQQLLGPVAGIGINLARGAGQMTDGHIQRGLETMLPKSIRDVAKAYRQATEGEQTIKGDIIMDDVSTWNVAMQGLGFGSAQMAKNYDAREYIKGKEKRIADKRSQLLTDYYMARKSGDMDEVQEVLERIKMFNAIHHPGERITGKSLALSFKAKLRSNERTQGGVYLNRNREYLREEGRFAD
ncbi:PLxRFG domain-containing protein [Aeromonas veronii]|uniref:PLxRFG domain-containing protein n=1 Tax=Aeromonas veronii TaxID=654 RepID=UPI00142F9385|nr:PLxRFG domain-containing protein [Aeromonas veronii]NJI09021.1 PLxRFG domain-containing protein [Aeromonas veronii]